MPAFTRACPAAVNGFGHISFKPGPAIAESPAAALVFTGGTAKFN